MKPKDYSDFPQAIGEHVKRARLLLRLTQAEAATRMGVTQFTVINWETGHTEPPIASEPAIRAFLGYDPYPPPRTLPERMLAKRRAMGWSIGEAARQFGVDEGTWGNYERGNTSPRPRLAAALEAFV